MKIIIKTLALFIIFSAVYLLIQNPKTANAQEPTDPAACSLNSIIIGTKTYTDFSIPIPQFQDFYLEMRCISNDPTDRGKVEATIFATVNGQQKNALLTSGALFATAIIPGNIIDKPYDGLPGRLSPIYAQYTITTEYASRFSGGTNQIVTCSIKTAPCTFLVFGDGVKPTSTPTITPYTRNCPAFRAFNPNPPIVNQSFQLQYNLPSSGVYDGVYRFDWQEKDGTKGTTPLDYSTASIYGVWVGAFTFNQETTITLIQHLAPRDEDIQCDQQTVFEGITSDSGLFPGKNPCTGGTCSTAIGKIPTSLGGFASAVLRIALGISGGIVLILMVLGSIRVMTSTGDPQRVAAGREMIIAAVAGALFIAFSVMIMQFLGTAVVPIPGLMFNF